MKVFTLLLPFLIIPAASTFAAKPQPCVLEATLLQKYQHSDVPSQLRDARRALDAFIGCDPANIDDISRKTFFAAVEGEFTTDHTLELEAWSKTYPESEALWEAINIQQRELRDYMDRLFDPARDQEFGSVVLRFGKGRTIARMGPSVKEKVKKIVTVGDGFYGLVGQYNPQLDGLEALGYWIDPANGSFTSREKDEFTQMLTALLDASDVIRGRHHRALVRTALESLAKSDDTKALSHVEKWLAKHSDKADELSALATKAVTQISKRVNTKTKH